MVTNTTEINDNLIISSKNCFHTSGLNVSLLATDFHNCAFANY